MEVRVFKRELRNLREYELKLKGANELIDRLYYELSGLKAIDYSKIPVHTPEDFSVKQRIYDELDKQKDRKEVLKVKINSIYEVLEGMPEDLRDAAVRVFADGERLEKIAREEFYLTDKGLLYRINKAIKFSLTK